MIHFFTFFVALVSFSLNSYSLENHTGQRGKIQCITEVTSSGYFPVRQGLDSPQKNVVTMKLGLGDCVYTLEHPDYINHPELLKRIQVFDSNQNFKGWALGNINEFSFWSPLNEVATYETLDDLGLKFSCLRARDSETGEGLSEYLNLRNAPEGDKVGELLPETCFLVSDHIKSYWSKVFTLSGEFVGYAANKPSYWSLKEPNWTKVDFPRDYKWQTSSTVGQEENPVLGGQKMKALSSQDVERILGSIDYKMASFYSRESYQANRVKAYKNAGYNGKPTYLYFHPDQISHFSDATRSKLNLIYISSDLVKSYLQKVHLAVNASSECLNSKWNRHTSFLEDYGLSAFYGARSRFKKMSRSEKLTYINRHKTDGDSDWLLSQMAGTSCVGMTLKCFKKGMESVGLKDLGDQIHNHIRPNVGGVELMGVLRNLGWRVLYFNPDTSRNAELDRLWSHRKLKPEHSYMWNEVKRKKTYYSVPVDDASRLVGFGYEEPDFLKQIPFSIGTAHIGYHVFPVDHGLVTEAHSTKNPIDSDNFERNYFNPLKGAEGSFSNLSDKAGPSPAPDAHHSGLKTLPLSSGLLALPPGYY